MHAYMHTYIHTYIHTLHRCISYIKTREFATYILIIEQLHKWMQRCTWKCLGRRFFWFWDVWLNCWLKHSCGGRILLIQPIHCSHCSSPTLNGTCCIEHERQSSQSMITMTEGQAICKKPLRLCNHLLLHSHQNPSSPWRNEKSFGHAWLLYMCDACICVCVCDVCVCVKDS